MTRIYKKEGKFKYNGAPISAGNWYLVYDTGDPATATMAGIYSTESKFVLLELTKFVNIQDENGDSYASGTDLETALIGFINPIEDPWELKVTSGQVPGDVVEDKFGRNPVITTTTDPEDIWEGGGVYPFSLPGVADIISLSSSDDGDTQPILIEGLDIDGALVKQTITLQGHTRVPLTTALWRIFRMENEADMGNDLVGTAYCYAGTESAVGVPSGASVIKAQILNGNNQTLMAVYTIPKGKVGFLFRGEVGVTYTGSLGAGNNFANGTYRSRRVGKNFKIKKFLSTLSQGNSNYSDKRDFPDPIPAFTDIVLTVDEVSEDMGVWGAFTMLLRDEANLSAAYLAAIGQPSTPV